MPISLHSGALAGQKQSTKLSYNFMAHGIAFDLKMLKLRLQELRSKLALKNRPAKITVELLPSRSRTNESKKKKLERYERLLAELE